MERFGELIHPEFWEGEKKSPWDWITINISSGSTKKGNDCGDSGGLVPTYRNRFIHVISTSYNILGMAMTFKFYTVITGEAAEVDVVSNKESIRAIIE